MVRRNKKTINTIEHIIYNNTPRNCNICNNCPISIYSSDKQINLGVGNIESNTIFILPMYNYKSDINYPTILKILIDIYYEIKGKNILEDVYITRLIKCYEKSEYNIEVNAASNCYKFLIYELMKLNMKNIVFFGNTYDRLIELVDTTYLFYNKNIYKLYNPAVMFYDNEKIKSKFIKDLSNIMYDS